MTTWATLYVILYESILANTAIQHTATNQIVLSSIYHLVGHGGGPVPGVCVEDPAARPPRHPHHDVRAVHRVHRPLRSVLAAAAVCLGFSLGL